MGWNPGNKYNKIIITSPTERVYWSFFVCLSLSHAWEQQGVLKAHHACSATQQRSCKPYCHWDFSFFHLFSTVDAEIALFLRAKQSFREEQEHCGWNTKSLCKCWGFLAVSCGTLEAGLMMLPFSLVTKASWQLLSSCFLVHFSEPLLLYHRHGPTVTATRLLLAWGGMELQPNRNGVKINVIDQGKREENKEQKVWLLGQSHEGVWCYYPERQSSGQSHVESGSLVSGLGWLCGCNYTNYSVFFCSPAFPLCTQL